MRKKRLFTPGPTPLIPEAQLAMAAPILHHRTPEFRELLLNTQSNLQKIYKTQSPVLILASSGTGAMEAAVANVLSPGDKALAAVTGKFGERWVEIAKTHQVDCVAIEKEYGDATSVDEICSELRNNPGVEALLIQGCETSTATLHDLEQISAQVRSEFPDILIVVDAITALGTQPLRTDDWDLDVVISGSQKSFGLPPGLAFLSLSQRAIDTIERKQTEGHYYLDLRKELKSQKAGSTAYTPAVSLVAGLYQATQQILSQGIDRIVEDAEQMATCTRAGLTALGFKLLSSSPANAVTAAFSPEGVDSEQLRKKLEESYGVKVAGGQGKLKGKIIRIAHLGYFDLLDVFSVLSAIELCLASMGHDSRPGKGVTAALEQVNRQAVVS